MLARVFWFCSLAVFSVSATVDPYNTTVLSVYGAIYPDMPHYYNYNVTHTYFRDAFLARNAQFNGNKCILPRGLTIDYWINEAELPVSVSYVNLYRQQNVYSRQPIKMSAIRNVMSALRNELQLPLREISQSQYYRNMRTLFSRSRKSVAMSQAEDTVEPAAAAAATTVDQTTPTATISSIAKNQYPRKQVARRQQAGVDAPDDIRNQLPSLSDYDDNGAGDRGNKVVNRRVNGSIAVWGISAETSFQPIDIFSDFDNNANRSVAAPYDTDFGGVAGVSDRTAALDVDDDATNDNLARHSSDSSELDESLEGFAFQRRARTFDPLIPIQIHFRRKPYPQSNFWQFITNNETSWRSYHFSVYPWFAGETDDLLYRFRHNFRHSLGLGHLDDIRSVMYPTNRLRNPIYGIDIKAVHQLLCSAQYGPRSRYTPTRRQYGPRVRYIRG